jgi:O-antigen ligase
MKTIFTIDDSTENKISFYHLALFLILLPFNRFYGQLVIVSFLLHTLIHINKQKLQKIIGWQNLMLSSVFMLNVLGLFWSRDNAEAFKDLERQSTIFLFPLLLSATGLDLAKYKKKLLVLFGITCMASILYLYADALRIIVYYHLPARSLLSPAFMNQNFSEPIGMHATYMSLYVSLSIATFLYYFLEEKNKNSLLLYLIGIAILSGGLLQLASRAVLIATILFVVGVFPFFITDKKIRLKFILVTLSVSLITVYGITKIDPLKKRYVAELRYDLSNPSANNEITEPRITRWRSALPLIKHSLLFGNGSGSEKRLLKENYFENKLYTSYLLELNAHNQYLSFLIKTGVLGLIVFLATLSTGFAAARRSRDIVFISFLIMISIVSFSENILDVNKGIFFYAFFFSFFIYTGKPFAPISRLEK